MAKVYFITGSLGSGKTLAGLDMVRRYLQEGRRVATNVNLNLDHLCSAENKHSRVIRVPDAPEINDLRAIGYGSSSSDDNTHGLLLLDELGTWFNARDFASKGRLEVIKWMIHMRKRRWDVVFVVQDFGMVDKQARGNIAQYLVTCQNSKTIWLFKMLPKFHLATVRMTATKMITDRWFYRGSDLYKAYDTEQLFHTGDDDSIIDADAEMSSAEKKSKEKNGLYCLLPPGYFSQTEKAEIAERFDRINKFRKTVVITVAALLFSGAVYALVPDPEPNAESQADPAINEGQIITSRSAELKRVDLPGSSLIGPYQSVLPIIEQYRSWKIHAIVKMGGDFKRVQITDGVQILNMPQVVESGVKVRYVGSRQIVLADDSGKTVTLGF